jgi:molybdate transport system substrate-binding protein
VRVAATAAGVLGAVLVAGCNGGGEGGTGTTVDVFAAASLTETFHALADDFEDAHPGTRVSLNLGSSAALAQQVVAGAPADVFASASPSAMEVVTGAGRSEDPTTFARNRLALVVPTGNPGQVRELADLARTELTIALCAPQVPCGELAATVLRRSGVTPAPDTLEQDVRAVLSKVRLGEVDAALVYRTDVPTAAGQVEQIALPAAGSVSTDYSLTVVAGAPDDDAARAFVTYVLSPEGQRVLADAGFS